MKSQDLLREELNDIAREKKDRARFLRSIAPGPPLPKPSMKDLIRESRSLRSASRKHEEFREKLANSQTAFAELNPILAEGRDEDEEEHNLPGQESENKRAKLNPILAEGRDEQEHNLPGQESEKKRAKMSPILAEGPDKEQDNLPGE